MRYILILLVLLLAGCGWARSTEEGHKIAVENCVSHGGLEYWNEEHGDRMKLYEVEAHCQDGVVITWNK